MPLTTLACTIDSTGISAPSYADILSSLQDSVRSIYGSDVAITPDTLDGQFLALLAQAINDANQANIAVYNSMRPSFAQGTSLDSIVKINNIARQVPSNSVADGDVTGVANTVINNGVVTDQNGNKWNLPPVVVIPAAGVINVSVTAQEPGAILAPAGSINQIATPVLGWQFFNSTDDALPGSPVETDAALRQRQSAAAALPSESNLAGLLAALQALDNPGRIRIYENPTNAPDGNGFVAHSIAVVIEGGNALDVGTTIGQKKAPGCATNGTTIQSYTDPNTGISYDGAPGNPPAISFYRLFTTDIPVVVTVHALAGWNDTIKAKIIQAITDFIGGLGIGVAVQYTRVFLPAFLNGSDPDASTYEVTALLVNGGNADVAIAFDHAAACQTAVIVNVI